MLESPGARIILATGRGAGVRIIAKKRQRDLLKESRNGDFGVPERNPIAWRKSAKPARWRNLGGLQHTLGEDKVGDCAVFFGVGARRLTRVRIETFAAFFHVGPGAFLPGPGARG